MGDLYTCFVVTSYIVLFTFINLSICLPQQELYLFLVWGAVCSCFFAAVLPLLCDLVNHRIIEWPRLKRSTMIMEFQPPCYGQGHQPPDQAAQSHIQPGFECLQGWGIHNLLGQQHSLVFSVRLIWLEKLSEK